MTAIRVRSAAPSDHPSFVRLFPELGVDDPILDEARFTRELVPTTVIAEDETTAAGYAWFQIMGETAYVRHIVTAPGARRRGVGRAMMHAVAARARERGCSHWCLNVKPENAAAIALYETCGMATAHASSAMRIAWDAVAAASPRDLGDAVRVGLPDDDARVEAELALVPGQLATSRAQPDRVILVIEEAVPESARDRRVVGAAVFHPHFPGAAPFRVRRAELALPLLRAIRAFARPEDRVVNLMSEGQPEVDEVLLAAGATVTVRIVHMRGPLPTVAEITR